jgi:hypothetical protein
MTIAQTLRTTARGSTARIAVKDGLLAGSIVLPAGESIGRSASLPYLLCDSLLCRTCQVRMNNAAKPVPCLGFLTVVEDAEQGLLGGYLLLNAAGRPLEFHCTAPVKANRAQEILYGPTLRPFLYGELIGQTLLAKSKLAPLLVCTDSEPMLAVRDHTHLPVALIVQSENLPQGAKEESSAARTDPASAAALPRIALGSSEIVLPAPYRADEQAIRAAWPSQADHLDLGEPFARIREALEEAQKTARAA